MVYVKKKETELGLNLPLSLVNFESSPLIFLRNVSEIVVKCRVYRSQNRRIRRTQKCHFDKLKK